MQPINGYTMNEWQNLKNAMADIFCSTLLFGGFFLNIDWFKVIGAVGVAVAAYNHIDQIIERRKKNKLDNKN